MNKLDGLSMDLENANMGKLKSVFPECFSEGKLDIDKLLSLCGEYIDNDFEKYKFEWKGKSECLRLAQKRSTGTLRPCKEKSVNFDDTQNVYIEGDNLEVLKLLQTAYFNKIKMIYIDPPYNTGNDFVYEDDFADPMARYKEVTQQTTKSNPETMGRYHTNWLNMMYPRLRLAANLLTDDGVIFISIDDNEVFNLKKVCDEVFGEENFVANIIWEKKYAPANDAKWLSDVHDNILLYAKNKDEWHPKLLPRGEEQNSRYTNRDNDPRGAWKAADMTVKSYSSAYDYEITTPSGRVVRPAQGRCWNTSKENFEKLVEDNRIWFGEDGNNVPAVKKFLTEVKDGVVPVTIWKYSDVGHNQEGRQEVKKLFDNRGLFDGPKPVKLLNRILEIANIGENDYILDFFSGSGSTAHAIMQHNAEAGTKYKFVCVQLPELCDEKSEAYKAGYKTICEIGEDRIKRAGIELMRRVTSGTGNLKGECWGCGMPGSENEWSYAIKNIIDIGFKVFRLDSSNLKLWDSTPITGDNQLEMFTERMNSMIDSIKDDRSDMDVIYEIMLKMGVPLDTAVQYIEIDGKIVYIVGDFLLMIALYNDITAEDIDAMAAYAPAKIVCAEQGFKDDTALSNAHYILRDKQIELKLV